MDMYTLLYFRWITNKDLLYSTWNSAQCYVPAWMGGESGGEWIHKRLNPFTVHLKLPQLVHRLYSSIKLKAFFPRLTSLCSELCSVFQESGTAGVGRGDTGRRWGGGQRLLGTVEILVTGGGA